MEVTGAEEEGRYPILEELLRKVGPHAKIGRISKPMDGRVRLLVNFGAGVQTATVEEGFPARLALAAPFELYRRMHQLGSVRGVWSRELGVAECEIVAYDEVERRDDLSDEEKDRRARRTLAALGLREGPSAFVAQPERPDPSTVEDWGAVYREWLRADGAREEAERKDFEERELDPGGRLTFEADGGATVSVGPCSDSWVVWLGHRGAAWRAEGWEEAGRRPVVRRCLTLRVEGVEIPGGKEAAGILERLGGAALFELERATGVGLTLGYTTALVRESLGLLAPAAAPRRLSSAYDREPLALYWYARSAEDEMPLLSFLAFYQVLEFYFPAYSPSERMKALREKLRELAAREVEEDDVEGVLEATGQTKKRFLPEERKQLMNVLERCVKPDRLEDFLGGDEERTRFYDSDASLKISRFGLPSGRGNGKRKKDRRNGVAVRIYEIRNRVVHAKADHDDELGPLLPFDLEARLLRHDVDLVAFLAQEVLAASGRPITGESFTGPEDPS